MHLKFYKESLGFALLSWKRMLPGLSDTVAALVLGTVALRVATTVFIVVLTLNIALGSFATLIMMHNVRAIGTARLLGVLIQAACMVSFSMAVLGIAASVIFPSDVGMQSMWFLLLSTPRPLLLAWTVYCQESLLRRFQKADVQRVTSLSVATYVVTSWTVLTVVLTRHLEPSALWLLIGVYSAQLFSAIAFPFKLASFEHDPRRLLSEAFRCAVLWPFDIAGIKVAFSGAATNVLEFGFLAIAGWIVVARFDDIAAFYFPLFNMFEWASGFAVGLLRVYTERHLSKNDMPAYWQAAFLYCAYTAIFVTVYLWCAEWLSPAFDRIDRNLAIFAVVYVVFDGLQLILRSKAFALPESSRLLMLSLAIYGVALIGLGAAWSTESTLVLFGALIAPLVAAAMYLGNGIVTHNPQ